MDFFYHITQDLILISYNVFSVSMTVMPQRKSDLAKQLKNNSSSTKTLGTVKSLSGEDVRLTATTLTHWKTVKTHVFTTVMLQ